MGEGGPELEESFRGGWSWVVEGELGALGVGGCSPSGRSFLQ